MALLDVEHSLEPLIEQAVNEFRCKVTEQMQALVSRNRAAAEAEQAKTARRVEKSQEALAGMLQAPSAPLQSDILLTDIVRLRVDGHILSVHSAVAKRCPYFAARLSGAWSENEILELKLPQNCCLEDLLALIHRLYEHHCAALQFENLGSALRMVVVASMLLVEGQILEEIANAMRPLVKSQEHEDALRTFVREHELPEIFSRICLSEAGVSMDVNTFKEMIRSAASGNAQQLQLAANIATTQTFASEEHKNALADAIDINTFGCYLPQAFAWWLNLVVELSSSDRITQVFQRISAASVEHRWLNNKTIQYQIQQDKKIAIQKTFVAYTTSSCNFHAAEAGLASPASILFYGNLLDGSKVLKLALRRASNFQQKMMDLCPAHLHLLLTPEVLSALPEESKIISRLCEDVNMLCTWASAENLRALTLDSRRVACVALAAKMNNLSDSVLSVVRDTLYKP